MADERDKEEASGTGGLDVTITVAGESQLTTLGRMAGAAKTLKFKNGEVVVVACPKP